MNIQIDKYLHFLCCLLIVAALYPLIGWWSVGSALATGILKEIYDWRDYGLFSWSDIIADTIGTVAGIAIIAIIKLLIS